MTNTEKLQSKRRLKIFALLFVVAVCISAVVYFQRASVLSLIELEQTTEKAASESRHATEETLAALSEEQRQTLASAVLSKNLLEQLLQSFSGAILVHESSGSRLTLEKVTAKFSFGFPRLTVLVRAEAPGVSPIELEADAVLAHRLADSRIELQLRFLGLKPLNALPQPLQTLLSAAAVERINAAIPPFVAPLPRGFKLVPKAEAIPDFWVPTANGRILLHLDVPAPPPLNIDLRPVAVWFHEDGLHAFLRLGLGAEFQSTFSPKQTKSATEDPEALLHMWGLEKGEDVRVRLPAQPVTALIQDLNQRSPEDRTVKVHGVNEEGQLMERTGGLPFGNGFKASLDGPGRLLISATAANLSPTWNPGSGIALSAHVEANGSVQVHVHGNPPRIKKRVKIGPFSWKIVDVEVGGGAGTSVGASASAAGDLAGQLRYDSASATFAFRIETPASIRAKVEIGGVPDELMRWLKAGFDVPLPRGRDLWRFELPHVLSETVTIPMPKGVQPEVRTLELTLLDPIVSFEENALSIRGKADAHNTPMTNPAVR